jgi:hypothetical protein
MPSWKEPGVPRRPGRKEGPVRTLIAAVLVGMALGLFATAALACNTEVYKLPNDTPQVQQPQPGTTT